MMPEPTSILAFRNGSIGNTLAAVPALRALRRRYPQARLSVVLDPVGYQLLEHCPWIDQLVQYDKRGRDRSLAAHVRLVRSLRRLQPSHAVLFKRFYRNGLLSLLSGARVRAGFRTGGKAPFLTHTVPYEEKVHVVDLDLRLAALLDATSDDRHLEIFLTDQDRAKARELSDSAPYVVAHYGGQTTPPDFLPPERFAELLRVVAGGGRRLILIGTGRTETEQARILATKVNGVLLATKLPLRVTAAVIEGAELFVGFNSGPAHISAAVGTPEVVLFRPATGTENELVKWSPVSKYSRTLVPPSTISEQEWATFTKTFADAARDLSAARAKINAG